MVTSIKSFLGGKHQHFFNEVLRLLLYNTGLAEQGTPSPRRLARCDWRPPTGQEGGGAALALSPLLPAPSPALPVVRPAAPVPTHHVQIPLGGRQAFLVGS